MEQHKNMDDDVDLNEDSDEGGTWFQKDADNELSYEKMVHVRNQKHPREAVFDENSDK